MTLILVVACGLFLAFANGANDNFKGVATLFGSKTANYREALLWATVATLAGSLTAWVATKGLLAAFSGKGLVPDAVVMLQSFPLAVLIASAITVMTASCLGLPVSTTHALIGALVGAGWQASPSGVHFAKLGSSFFAPLLISPLVAILCTTLFHSLMQRAKARFNWTRESCLCVGNEPALIASVPLQEPALMMERGSRLASGSLEQEMIAQIPSVRVGEIAVCRQHFPGRAIEIRARGMIDFLHLGSAGAVSFARGLNDTPKIAALLLVGGAFPSTVTFGLVAGTIAIGGLFYARKVADTMANRVTVMSEEEGFSANLVTSLIVISASMFGLPVSTTHVSCGSLFGIGAMTKQAQWRTIQNIILAWLITLPVGALLGALSFKAIQGIFWGQS